MTIRLYTENWELTLIVIVVVVLIAAMVAAWCKLAGRESRREEQEEKEHPCAYCQRWGECNGVDEACPLLQAYAETRSAIQQPAFFRGRWDPMKRSDDGGCGSWFGCVCGQDRQTKESGGAGMSSTANEKRLIYAEDLFTPVDFTVLRLGRSGSGKTMAMFEKLFRKRVEMAPTVDAVEVVRCKDCKHYIEDASMSPDFIASYCNYHGNDYSFMAHDFCSNGERRTDG